jgi:hypothetical protein
MKTAKQIDHWITSVVKKELDKIPGIVIDSAKRLNRLDLIADQVSRKTGIRTPIVLTIIKNN